MNETIDSEQSGTTSRSKARLVIAGLSVVIVALAVAVLLVRVPSPGAETEAYLRELQSGDFESAYLKLSKASKESVGDPARLRYTAVGSLFSGGIVDQFAIGKATVGDGRATVEVTLSRGATEIPLTVSLVKEGRRWRVET